MSSFDSHYKSRADSTLAAYIGGGRLPHAILVEGRGDTGGFALKIAKAALCSDASNGAEKPCGLCRDCLKADKGVHPDILSYSGGEGKRSFHIDTVRELRQEAYVRPNEAQRKAFILQNVQNMTVQAQNALLKIIEEPPKNVIFILTCENKSALLETILSRVSVIAVNDAPEDDTENETTQKARDILDALLHGSELDALAAFSAYERDRTAMSALMRTIRDEAAARAVNGVKNNNLARGERQKLLKLISIIDETETGIGQNVGGLLMAVIIPARFKAEA